MLYKGSAHASSTGGLGGESHTMLCLLSCLFTTNLLANDCFTLRLY